MSGYTYIRDIRISQPLVSANSIHDFYSKIADDHSIFHAMDTFYDYLNVIYTTIQTITEFYLNYATYSFGESS